MSLAARVCTVSPVDIGMSHRKVQPHVSTTEVACYRTERGIDGGMLVSHSDEL